MNNFSVKKQSGFTLIELIIVIIIIATLAATALPKFIDLQKDSHAATVKGTGGAFSSAIELAHIVWISKGYSGPANDLHVYGDDSLASGSLDFNQWGYPVQHWLEFEDSPNIDAVEDCISVWETVLAAAPTVSTGDTDDYKVEILALGKCKFTYNAASSMSISYNANTGQVDVNTGS